MRHWLLYFFFLLIFIFSRFSFLPALGLDSYIHLSLVILFFTVMIFGKKKGFFMALVLGIIDGWYAWQAPFLFYLILYSIMIFGIDYLLTAFFTNRSPYTVTIVSLIGSFSFFILENVFWKILSFFSWWNLLPMPFLKSIPFFFWQSCTTAFLILFAFHIFQRIGLIFRTSFLPASISKK